MGFTYNFMGCERCCSVCFGIWYLQPLYLNLTHVLYISVSHWISVDSDIIEIMQTNITRAFRWSEITYYVRLVKKYFDLNLSITNCSVATALYQIGELLSCKHISLFVVTSYILFMIYHHQNIFNKMVTWFFRNLPWK